ncbi:MAG: hypothetical protein K8R58_00215 [Bacteroidales bacterium]|nr:hypothetical protein [Bacteroidales bacterium]
MMERLNSKEIIIGANCSIAPTVIFIRSNLEGNSNRIFIGDNVVIRDGSIIYDDVFINNGVIIDHFCIIREGSNIGANTRIMNSTHINKNVLIGENCRIGGLIASRVKIGKNTTSLGHLVHRYSEHGKGRIEDSPVIGDNVIIGRLALVVGGVSIASYSRVKAGGRITKDINSAFKE